MQQFYQKYRFRQDPSIIVDAQRQELKRWLCAGIILGRSQRKVQTQLPTLLFLDTVKQWLCFTGMAYGSVYLQLQYFMFGKLAQLRTFIAHAITSLESQRPQLPSDPTLPKKLAFLLDHVLKAPLQGQFKAYHQLQAPEVALNELLPQLYHSVQLTTEQVTAILHFYTFLLLNCQNELVLCKIVSDSFVLEMTEIHTQSLHLHGESPLVDLEEANSYKIALVKAYVSRLGAETVKYMVLGDRLRIFESCVNFCVGFQGRREWGVEITCMSNALLLVLKFVGKRQEYASLCFQEKGTERLLKHLVTLIHGSIGEMLVSSGDFEQQLQSLSSAILFAVDLLSGITHEQYKILLIRSTSEQLRDLRELFWQLVDHFTGKQTSEANYMQILELIKVLLKLLPIYFKIDQLTGLFQRSLLPILDKFILSFTTAISHLPQEETARKSEVRTLLHLFCSVSEILAMVLQQGGFLQRRKSAGKEEKELKALVVTRIVDIIQLILSENAEAVASRICAKSIKLLLLSLMQLTVENYHTLHEYSVLRLHQHSIAHLKLILKNSDVWDYVVLNYEALIKQASLSQLNVEPTEPNEYQHCQTHDPYRVRQDSFADAAINAILLNQWTRSFRFMIVEMTYVSTDSIKLQKSYHTNFISPGWNFEPGKEIEGEVNEVCRIVHLTNDLHVPITIVVDEECLIFVHIQEGHARKVILNIRYKMVEGFTQEKEIVRIKLKGAQEILVQGDKGELQKFKNYLIEKRDKARQRELKFIHHSLDLYFNDNQRVIAEMGERDIETDPQPQYTTKQSPKKTENHEEIHTAISSVEPSKEESQLLL